MYMNVRVATFNVQHCETYTTRTIDYDAFAAYIASFEADVVGLNEIRGAGRSPGYDDQMAILSEKLGYRSYFAEAIRIGGENPYGNGVLTRTAPLSCETVGIPDPAVRRCDTITYETRAVAKITLKEPELTVLVTHFGLNPDEAENAVQTVLSLIPDTPCVLMGDFNLQPDSPILTPIREKLCDVTPGELLTFPSDAPNRKIDYIFVSPSITARRVVRKEAVLSDHLPLLADLEL